MTDSDGPVLSNPPAWFRRYRWWLAAVCLCVILLIGATAWVVNRPLNKVEQRLVGTWRNTTAQGVFTLHADRTRTAPGFPPGSWYARDDRMYSPSSIFEETYRTFAGTRIDCSLVLTFRDVNNVSVFCPANGCTFQLQRVVTSSETQQDPSSK